MKAGVLIHPTRMALSGAAGGPPLFDLVEAMGREATVDALQPLPRLPEGGEYGAEPAQG